MIKQFTSIDAMNLYIDGKIQGSFLTWDSEKLGEYVKKLKSGDVYFEVGTQFGKSIASAIFQSPEGVKFYTCDVIDQPHIIGEKISLSREEFFKVSEFGDAVTFIRADSLEIAKNWNKEELAMVFIDGDHSYESVKADILAWEPHLKHGGFMLFHDYDHPQFGVKRAVDELIRDSGLFKDLFYPMGVHDKCSSIAGATKI